MKIVTSVTVWNDAVGKRMSITYSEIDSSGQVISDNKRVDRVITDATVKNTVESLMGAAQDYIDAL